MKTSRRKIEELLWVTGLHRQARTIYKHTVGRSTVAHQESMEKFYSRLLPVQSLVFDIGANVGILSAIFSSLGARVIALEPNADCVRHIQLSYPGVNVIQAVAGPKNGLAVIRMSDERDDLSSLSPEWMASMKREHAEFAELWSKEIAVPMLTLDTLAEQFGSPTFIKIDVEGFEDSVLAGLSAQPPLLSFEYNCAYPEAITRCLDRAIFSADSVFNFTIGDPTHFQMPTWVSKERLREALGKLARGDVYGDIFVKKL
jgi:FkbM family methyltransferase